jgi:tRNA U34 5-methylaminomethyl-2-thiouridine-forming methyltransferase MnmC
MNDLQFIITADGSKTIFHPGKGEHYHSINGALQESKHVFLESGLQYFLKQGSHSMVSILEVGFGTGLNFLLSAQYAYDNHITLHYTGIEAYPISRNMISQSGYDKYVRKEIWDLFTEKYEKTFQEETLFSPSIQLEIVRQKIAGFETSKRFDVLYFDAFSAVSQPEMWTNEALSQVCQYLKAGGIFVTYAMNGNLKRSMQALGFSLEKIPGASGKREMLRATKTNSGFS